jgi:Holliday junction DNA helicase RuvA
MIALLSGEVAVRRTDHVVVSAAASATGWRSPAETLRHTPAIGKHATLHTHLIVRDDALALYGFATEAERDLFLLLIGVQSVGPRRSRWRCCRAARRASCSPLCAAATRAGCRRSRESASAPRSGSSSSCARRSARRRPAIRSASRAATTRDCSRARGLVGLGFSPEEAEQLLDGAPGETPEDLITHALKGAREP